MTAPVDPAAFADLVRRVEALEAARPAPPPPGPYTHGLTEGRAVTSCCARTPFELPVTDRITANPTQVTCPGRTL